MGQQVVTRSDLTQALAVFQQDMLAGITVLLDSRFGVQESRFQQIEVRFQQIDARFEQIDARFEQIDARFEKLEGDFREAIYDAQNEILKAVFPQQERINLRFAATDTKTTEINERMAILERRLFEIEKKLLMRPPAA